MCASITCFECLISMLRIPALLELPAVFLRIFFVHPACVTSVKRTTSGIMHFVWRYKANLNQSIIHSFKYKFCIRALAIYFEYLGCKTTRTAQYATLSIWSISQQLFQQTKPSRLQSYLCKHTSTCRHLAAKDIPVLPYCKTRSFFINFTLWHSV